MTVPEELRPLKFPMGVASKGAAIAVSGEIIEIISDSHLSRGTGGLLDIASHIGNFTEGSKVTMGAGLVLGIMSIMKPCFEAELSEESFKRRAKYTAIAAVAVSAVVQYVGERYGLSNGLMKNTPDMMDAVYGTVYSIPVSMAGYKLAVSTDERIREKRQAKSEEWEIWYDENQSLDNQLTEYTYKQEVMPTNHENAV